ncbi:MAG: Na+/H+ antiporter subunit B [Chloroflexi bacterium]|nr:Na+/H+ antiporter subunit B [Chloroflexota bacterium]
MDSLILRTATRYLLPLLLMFSLFVLFRGHNEPGGGFVGGLLAASAIALYAIGFGVEDARRLVRFAPQQFIGVGLLTAVSSTLVSPLFTGRPFMTALWNEQILIPAIGKIGTPFFFDIGVYLTVLGVVLLIIFTLQEELIHEELVDQNATLAPHKKPKHPKPNH